MMKKILNIFKNILMIDIFSIQSVYYIKSKPYLINAILAVLYVNKINKIPFTFYIFWKNSNLTKTFSIL